MKKKKSLQSKFLLSIILIIVPTLSIIFLWAGYQHETLAKKQLIGKAQVLSTQIILTRKWISDVNGILVKKGISEISDRKLFINDEIDTDRGKFMRFTPSMVTKDLSRYSLKQDKYWFRIFSETPMNPENRPDDFERTGLHKFKEGTTDEYYQFGKDKGKKYFQYMVPLYMDQTCLTCHSKHGVDSNPIYGGLSVFFPIEKVGSFLKFDHINLSIAGICLIFLITYTLFFLLKHVVLKPLKEFENMADQISAGNYDARVNLNTCDELEDLGDTFNFMGKKLSQHKKRMQDEVEKAVKDLSEANSKLQTLDTLKSDFLANMSHELRSPLTVIRGGIDYLKRTEHDDNSKNTVSIVDKNVNRLILLVSDIFDFTKLEAGKMDWNFERTNITDLISDTIYILSPLASEKKISIQFDTSEVVSAEIDFERFEQVLVNIIENAIKFSDEKTDISIWVINENKTITIEFKDQGPGIPEENLESIFEKFQTIPSSGKDGKPKGTGLGLAICRKIIHSHNGTIQADNRSEKGSVISIQIPESRD